MIVALLAAQVTLQGTLQHVLDKHSHVPFPVRIETQELSVSEIAWGMPNKPMPKTYVPPVAWVYPVSPALAYSAIEPWGFMIGFRRREFHTMPIRPMTWVVMHEVCHVIQDYKVLGSWELLTDKERNDREANADSCATQMLHQHEETCR